MSDYDLYGVDTATVSDAALLVGALLSLSFNPHDSSYLGDYYFAEGEGDESFKICENTDPHDGDPAEASHSDHKILLYVDGSDRGSDLRHTLQSHSSLTLLRQESL